MKIQLESAVVTVGHNIKHSPLKRWDQKRTGGAPFLVVIVTENSCRVRHVCGNAALRDALKKDPSVGFCF